MSRVARTLLAALACGGSSSPAAPDAAVPEGRALVIGTGLDDDHAAFLDIPDDRTMPLHSGFQGGYHVYLQARMHGLDPTDVGISARFIDRATGEVVRNDTLHSAMIDEGTGWRVFPQPMRLFMCPPEVSDWTMYDHDFDLTVRLTDSSGAWIERTTVAHPVCPDGDRQCREDPNRGCASHHGRAPGPPT